MAQIFSESKACGEHKKSSNSSSCDSDESFSPEHMCLSSHNLYLLQGGTLLELNFRIIGKCSCKTKVQSHSIW